MSANSEAKNQIVSKQAAAVGAKKQQKPNVQVAAIPCSTNRTQNIGNRNNTQVVAKTQVNRAQTTQVGENTNNNCNTVRKVPNAELMPQRAEAQQLRRRDNRAANLRIAALRGASTVVIAGNSNRRLPIMHEGAEQREMVDGSNKITTPKLICASLNVRPRLVRPRPQRPGNINFKCYICKGSLRNAVITICGHLYCWPCLWEFERTRLGCTYCPHCRRQVQMHEDVVPYFGGIEGEDDDIAAITEDGAIVGRPSAFRVNTTANGSPWFHTESLVPRGSNAANRLRQNNIIRRFNGNVPLTIFYDLLINIEFGLVFLIIFVVIFF